MLKNNLIFFMPHMVGGGVEKNLYIIANDFAKKIKHVHLITSRKNFNSNFKNVKILWASVRETFNYNQALRTNTDIITVPPQFIKKIKDKKISLENYSKITVKQFFFGRKEIKV